MFASIINKCKDFVTIFLNNSELSKDNNNNNNNNNNKMVINIILYTFLGFLIYIFFWDLALINIFQIFIFSIISFAFSMFISDKFKFSNNKLIKILQKFVFINSILVLIGLILYLFDISLLDTAYASDGSENNGENKYEVNNNKDVAHITSNIDDKNDEYYNFKIKKDIFDNAMERGKDLVVAGAKDIAPNLGIGAAAGKAAAEAFKHTSGMATVPRIAVVGSTALATAAGTKIGIELGKATTENKKIENEIDGSKLEEIDTDGSHSPSDFGGGFINNPLEDNEIPLIIMVNGLSYLNYIEFSLILALFSLSL
jgi:hypothetical protein